MPTEKYDIFFSGQVINGQDESETRTQIGQMFKANQQQLEHLFSGTPVKVKSNIDLDQAVKYRLAFRNAGALIDIKPLASESVQPAPLAESKDTPVTTPIEPEAVTLDLLPPQTGSLIDCAPEISPTPIPDISRISLASTGATIDESELAPPANINTGDLSLNPANTGSLEDCQKNVQPAKISDINALEIINPELKK